MALNHIVFTEKIAGSFLRYQLTAYLFADARLAAPRLPSRFVASIFRNQFTCWGVGARPA